MNKMIIALASLMCLSNIYSMEEEQPTEPPTEELTSPRPEKPISPRHRIAFVKACPLVTTLSLEGMPLKTSEDTTPITSPRSPRVQNASDQISKLSSEVKVISLARTKSCENSDKTVKKEKSSSKSARRKRRNTVK